MVRGVFCTTKFMLSVFEIQERLTNIKQYTSMLCGSGTLIYDQMLPATCCVRDICHGSLSLRYSVSRQVSISPYDSNLSTKTSGHSIQYKITQTLTEI